MKKIFGLVELSYALCAWEPWLSNDRYLLEFLLVLTLYLFFPAFLLACSPALSLSYVLSFFLSSLILFALSFPFGLSHV